MRVVSVETRADYTYLHLAGCPSSAGMCHAWEKKTCKLSVCRIDTDLLTRRRAHCFSKRIQRHHAHTRPQLPVGVVSIGSTRNPRFPSSGMSCACGNTQHQCLESRAVHLHVGFSQVRAKQHCTPALRFDPVWLKGATLEKSPLRLPVIT